MKRGLLTLLVLAILSVAVFAQPTIVHYIVDIEEETPQDYLEVTFTTNAEGQNLEEAIQQARTQADNLKHQAEQICKTLIKDKSSCKQAIEIGKVDIKPSYKQHKEETFFEKITVTYEIVITWKETAVFGSFVDQLLTVEGIIIEKIEWKTNQDLHQNNFLAESIDKSTALCAELGKNFIKVVSIEELRDEPEQPEEEAPAEQGEEEEEEEEPEQEEPEEEQELTSFKITIKCDGKKEPAKKKK